MPEAVWLVPGDGLHADGGHAHASTRLPIRASYGRVSDRVAVGRPTVGQSAPCRSQRADTVLEVRTEMGRTEGPWPA